MDTYLQEMATTATSDKVKQILDKFKSTETHEVNKEGLVEFQHKDLAEMITFLKTTSDKFPSLVETLNKKKIPTTKGPAASVICEFLEQLKLSQCQACNNEYLPVLNENASENKITCQICNKFAHKACYDSSMVNPEIGIYYVCTLCNINFKTFKITPVEEVIEEFENIDNETKEQPAKEKKAEEGTPETCPLFLEARCPYGLRGDGCSFFHPKSCYYYSKFGNDPINGCRRGKRCKYVHPKLCPNSVNMKICLNEECKLVHLKGTQRKKPRENSQQAPRYLDRNEHPNYRHSDQNVQPQYHNPATISPWENRHQTARETSDSTPQPSSNETRSGFENMQKNMQSFLEKYLEQMKVDINNQIEKQVEGRLNNFVNSKPSYTSTNQWYHPNLQQTITQPLPAQIQAEKSQEVTNSPQVQFMGYPMIIPAPNGGQ